MMTLPKHGEPKGKRKSSAPYNFVPLPEKVVTVKPMPSAEERDSIADDVIAPQDKYYLNRHTGYLDCKLTTLTPMYTRCMLTPKLFEQFNDDPPKKENEEQERERLKKEQLQKAPFFHIDDIEEPMIPGSSLRGMVRTLVEIIGYSKIQPVTKRNQFFRTVDDSTLGKYYRNRTANKVETGFLTKRNGKYYIKKCTMGRVHYDLIGGKDSLYVGKNAPNQTPRWTSDNGGYYQYQKVWVDLKGDKVIQIETQPDKKLHEARLVVTGDVPVKREDKKKKKAFVFLLDELEEIEVKESLVQRFHDDDQLTQWQEKAFPANKPAEEYRERNGYLCKNLSGEGDPVFFLREGDKLIFFGRAFMFRLPYKQNPFDLIPKYLRVDQVTDSQNIDLAEAIFGFVRDKKAGQSEAQTLAGRVFFTNASYDTDWDGIWLQSSQAKDSQNIIAPPILSSPKPTSFQHYLVQKKPDDRDTLKHYDSSVQDTVIRGHKLYWHRRTTQEDITADSIEAQNFYRQYTRIQPVKEGVNFKFRVYFENLSKVELGALLWAINLPPEHYHKLGMGKPHGMGSVAVEADLCLDDREKRYEQLFDTSKSDWFEPGSRYDAGSEKQRDVRRKFEEYVLAQINTESETEFSNQPRIKELLTMLRGDMTPARSETAYLSKPEDFKTRPVLPTPQDVFKQAEGSNKISKWIDPKNVKAALQQEKPQLQYKIEDIVEAEIVGAEWNQGEVAVELENGEKGQLYITEKKFKQRRGRKLQLRIVEIKRGVYYLRLADN